MDLCKSGRYDWCVIAGDDEVIVFTFRDLLYDVNRQWSAQVRTKAGASGDPIATAAAVGSEGAEGEQVVTVALDSTLTRLIGDTGHRTLQWDLQVVDTDVTLTPIAGDVNVQMDVTV